MKNIIATLVLGLFLRTASADLVTPIDTDAYKSVILTITMLDERLLQDTSRNSGIYLTFGDKTVNIPTKNIKKGFNGTKQLTIPLDAKGDYSVMYYSSSDSYSYYNQIWLLQGEVTNGTKNLEVRLKRIDVQNMVVTRPDGSTYVVENGNANVTSPKLNSEFKTNYGMDVPVGFNYEVKVGAETEDGFDSYTTKLDFTKF